MPRPRRPILASSCATLLLATGTLWARSYSALDTVRVRRGPTVTAATSSRGSILLSYIPGELHDIRLTGPNRRWIEYETEPPIDYATTRWPVTPTFRKFGFALVAIQFPPPPPSPVYTYYGTGPFRNYCVLTPIWPLLLPPTLGPWWFWRGKRASAGVSGSTVGAKRTAKGGPHFNLTHSLRLPSPLLTFNF